jgi:hypothetical protein
LLLPSFASLVCSSRQLRTATSAAYTVHSESALGFPRRDAAGFAPFAGGDADEQAPERLQPGEEKAGLN